MSSLSSGLSWPRGKLGGRSWLALRVARRRATENRRREPPCAFGARLLESIISGQTFRWVRRAADGGGRTTGGGRRTRSPTDSDRRHKSPTDKDRRHNHRRH